MDVGLASIHDSAIRSVTPSPLVDQVLTGVERRTIDRCWRPAGTVDWLLIHTRRGRASVALRDLEVHVGAGETLLYQPGAAQDFGGADPDLPWEIVWAHFEPRPHWLELLRWEELSTGVLHTKVTDTTALTRVERFLLEANRLATSGLPHAASLARNALEAALLWWDLRNPRGRPLDARVVEAIDYVSRNARRRFTVEELAHAVHLSPSRFAHLFTRETGLTPRRFVERQRLDRAKQLLELTTLPVAAVAREVGFESQFYFSTRFKRATGMPPTVFRAEKQSRYAVATDSGSSGG